MNKMTKTIDLEKHKNNYLQFMKSRKNVMLCMMDEVGKPFSSYAPFVMVDSKFYIYISKIAEHYRLLERNSVIDAMFIADEAMTPNKFATERARFECNPKNMGNEQHEDIFALFNEDHGQNLIDVLRGLDFSLFELTPQKGRYVVGFGMAFDLDINGESFVHVVVDKKQ